MMGAVGAAPIGAKRTVTAVGWHRLTLRDNGNYRAANGCSQGTAFAVVCLPRWAAESFIAEGCHSPRSAGAPIPLRERALDCQGGAGDRTIGIHCNGIHTYPMEWTSAWNGLVCNGIHSIPMVTSPRRGARPGRTQRGSDSFHYNPVNAINHPEVRTMPSCVACGAELEPAIRAPHTVYVKTLYRIGGQDYCRHHIIRAAVAAGVITEVKAGAGPVTAVPRV